MPKLGFDIYIAVLYRANPQGGFGFSNDVAAFNIMAHVLGTIGTVVLPALLIEAEMRRAAMSASAASLHQ